MNIPVSRRSLALVALMLSKSPDQAGANTGANATLSETVALLIDGWVDMCTVVPVIDVHISKADGIPN